jgi:pimeloyl-ACP methyl ester carboxylesterase
MRNESTRSDASMQDGNLRATEYRTIRFGALNVFFREARPADASAVLWLHGFPTSSRLYDGLLALLADRTHECRGLVVIA